MVIFKFSFSFCKFAKVCSFRTKVCVNKSKRQFDCSLFKFAHGGARHGRHGGGEKRAVHIQMSLITGAVIHSITRIIVCICICKINK